MSDLRIGLVAEGKTDLIIIEAALRSILGDRTFILQLLQPETSAPLGAAGQHGGGWGGVYRWCRQHVSMQGPTGINPSLQAFNLILLHVDADVAGESYQNANINNGGPELPCQLPCPPAYDSVNALWQVLCCHWLDLPSVTALPVNWIFCIPSMCSDAWLASALFHATAPGTIASIECNQNLVAWLAQNPFQGIKLIRGRKIPASYTSLAPQLTDAWRVVCQYCSLAHRFDGEVRAALP